MARRLSGLLVLIGLLALVPETKSAYIYFGEGPGGRISRANLDGTGKVTLVSGLSIPIGPTLDLARGQMYWGELGSATMHRANLDGSGQTILISGPNGGSPALDLAGGRMYWAVSSGGNIRRAKLDSSEHQVLITGLNDPHAPVLDLVAGKIYWAEYGVGNILRANLDGTGRQTLVPGLASSSLLALDVAGGKMYWTVQRANGEIRRANLDGTSQQILVGSQNSPAGIALDPSHGHVYWANFGGGDIRRANLDGSGETTLITGLSGPVMVTLDLISDGPPVFQFQPRGQSALVGGTVSLVAGAAGANPLFYQWQFNGEVLASATNSTLQLSNLNPSNTGDYSVTVSNVLGVITSAVARVIVVDRPVILIEPVSRTVVESNTVSFTVSAIGVAPLHYQWRFNGTNLGGATTTNLTLSNVQTNQAGEYIAVVSNSYGVATSMVAMLTVLVPPRIVQLPENQSVLEGGIATFTAVASGSLPLSFRWVRNGVTFTNGIIVNTGSTSSLTLTNVSMTNNGATFRVALTNLAGLAPSSSSARLTVLADFDRDGMADEWEIQHGLNTNSVADAAPDPDGDGMSNRDEYSAGTDPSDVQSLLKINPTISAGVLSLQFFAVSNRTYSVLFAPSVSATVWERMLDVGAQSSNRVETVTDSAPPTARRFYRVTTPQWP